jgi:hypothetical protein
MVRSEQSRLPGPLELPCAPVQSIASVVTLDEWGNSTTIPPATLPVAPPAVILGSVADLALEPATLLIGCETVLSGGLPLRDTRLQHLQVSMVTGYVTRPCHFTHYPVLSQVEISLSSCPNFRGHLGWYKQRSQSVPLNRW